MNAARVVLLVFGVLFVLAAFGLILGGGVVLAVDSGFKDEEGYFITGFQPLAAESPAITTQPARIHWDTNWERRNRKPVTIKVEAYNDRGDKPVFIGIARDTDLNRYLQDSAYEEVTGFNPGPAKIEMWHHSGSAVPAPPASQNFWVASVTGTGHQTLKWDVTSGDYSMVLMNADASAPIDAHVAVGARIAGVIHAVGMGLLIGGLVVLVIGGVMIFFAARGW